MPKRSTRLIAKKRVAAEVYKCKVDLKILVPLEHEWAFMIVEVFRCCVVEDRTMI